MLIFSGFFAAFLHAGWAFAGTCTIGTTGIANTNAVGAAYVNSRWLVFGEGGSAYGVSYSAASATPPLSFTNVKIEPNSLVQEDIAYGNGTYVAIGKVANYIGAYSTDLATWTPISYSGLPAVKSFRIQYGSGYFVTHYSFETTQQKILVSPNGASWSEANLPESAKWMGLAYGGGKFVALSQDGKTAYSAAPGGAWSSGASLPYDSGVYGPWREMEYCNGYFYAMSEMGYISRSASGISGWGSLYNVGQGRTAHIRLRCDAVTGRLIMARVANGKNSGFYVMNGDITQWDYVDTSDKTWFRGAVANNNWLVSGASGTNTHYINLNNCSFSWYSPERDRCDSGQYSDNGVCTDCPPGAPDGYVVDSPLGATSITQCYKTIRSYCDMCYLSTSCYYTSGRGDGAVYDTDCSEVPVSCAAGYYWNYGIQCGDRVRSDYYSPNGDVNRYQCPANTKTLGEGEFAASANDCLSYIILRTSADPNRKLIMHPKAEFSDYTLPRLAIKTIQGAIYYGILAPPLLAHVCSSYGTNGLKVKFNNEQHCLIDVFGAVDEN